MKEIKKEKLKLKKPKHEMPFDIVEQKSSSKLLITENDESQQKAEEEK